jgi:hypothetical protein
MRRAIKRIILFFHKLIRYGFSVAFWDMFDSQRKRIKIFSEKINDNKHAAIVNWLAKRFKHVIADFNNQIFDTAYLEGTIPPQIWVCWWDGIGMMPPIVKACYNSLLENAGDFKITVIDKDNFKDFITVPDHILERIKDKTMTITHFSDIIRMSLLAKYGGIWLDSTILVTGKIKITTIPFFTIKREFGGEYVPKRRWTGNCIGGKKDNPLFQFVCKFLFEYWREYSDMIDYFLYDYSIATAYHSVPIIRDIIDNAPLNPQNFYIIQDNLSREHTPEFFESLTKNTVLHKLTWKEQYPRVSENNKLTVYGYILEKYGDA